MPAPTLVSSSALTRQIPTFEVAELFAGLIDEDGEFDTHTPDERSTVDDYWDENPTGPQTFTVTSNVTGQIFQVTVAIAP